MCYLCITNSETNMSKKIIALLGIGLVVLVGFIIFGMSISYGNKEVDLHNRFKQKMDERTAFYDKMWKTLSGKSQVALKNDSSFTRNVDAIMAGRKDAQGLFMKWVQESNPNANFEQVSALYADLSRSIEAQRDGFFMEERMIQDIVREHNNLLEKAPSRWFVDAEPLVYKPITSDRTDNVIRTGKDNNDRVF